MKYRPNKSGKIVKKEDYSKTIIFDSNDFDGRRHLLQTVIIPPKTKQRVHYHKKQTEVHFILEGEALFIFNGREILARPGDAFITPPMDKHSVWNKSDKEFKLVVFKIDLPEEDDTVWLGK